jgi:hypothetical protein
MKRSYFLGALLVALVTLQSFTLLAGKAETWNSPVYLTLPNDGSIKANSTLHVSLQFEADSRIQSLEISEPLNFAQGQEVKTAQLKDGKVDVDIIIRGGSLLPILRPFSLKPSIRVQILDVHFITVDNISGVYQAGTDNPTTGVIPRITNIAITSDDNGAVNNVTSSLEYTLSQETSRSTVTTSTAQNAVINSEVVLYPNPVRDGNLFIRIPESMSVTQVTVVNALGGLVKNIRPDASSTAPIQISLDGLSAGVYFVRIHSSTGDLVKKFNVSQ